MTKGVSTGRLYVSADMRRLRPDAQDGQLYGVLLVEFSKDNVNAMMATARAGEHGRGFAVVVEEVRSLALRTAEASKQSNELIGGTLAKVREGAEGCTDVSSSLDTIVQRAQQVSEYVSGIAMASKEQALGVEQINGALRQLEQLTQGNAASAEQASAAAHELDQHSASVRATVEELVTLVLGKGDRDAQATHETIAFAPNAGGGVKVGSHQTSDTAQF